MDMHLQIRPNCSISPKALMTVFGVLALLFCATQNHWLTMMSWCDFQCAEDTHCLVKNIFNCVDMNYSYDMKKLDQIRVKG